MLENLGREKVYEILAARHSPEIQAALAAGRVAVAGLGGLGSQVALTLARCGVGALHLIDFDRVDVANIHRQAYFPRHIGRLKTDALAEMILAINPWAELSLDNSRLAKNNIPQKLAGWPIVVEAFDRAESKAELVNTVLSELPEAVVVCASGLAGLGPAGEIKSRCLGPRLYLCGDGFSDIDQGLGLAAPRVMVCAGHQANLVIRILAGLE